jgi:hypothetical protein
MVAERLYGQVPIEHATIRNSRCKMGFYSPRFNPKKLPRRRAVISSMSELRPSHLLTHLPVVVPPIQLLLRKM